MPLDIPGLGVTGQTIKYARAAWDVARDGGGPGLISIPSQQLPIGARVIGYSYDTPTPFVDTGVSTFDVNVGPIPLLTAQDPVLQPYFAYFGTPAAFLVSDGSFPLAVLVTGTGYSAGAMYIFIFYV